MLQDGGLELVCFVRESLNCQQIHSLIISAGICQKRKKLAMGANSKWLLLQPNTEISCKRNQVKCCCRVISWNLEEYIANLHLCLSLTVFTGCLALRNMKEN